jgi:predicted transcriptional regulator
MAEVNGAEMAEPTITVYETDTEEEKRAIAKARAEIAAGKGVPHKKVRVWLEKLREGKVEPPPCA